MDCKCTGEQILNMQEFESPINQLIQQAWILFKMKRYSEAKKVLWNVLSIEPLNMQGLYLLTHVCIKMRDLEEADHTISSCINNYPEYADAFYLKAIVCNHKQQFNLALEMIDEAIRLFPYNPNYFLIKSNIYQLRGLPKKAIAFVNEGLSLSPENQHLLQQKAVLLFQLRDRQAEKFLSDAMTIDPEVERNFGIKGMLHLEKIEIDEAEFCFLEGLRLEPTNADFLTGLLAVKKLRNGFYREAIRKGFRRMEIISYPKFLLSFFGGFGLGFISHFIRAAYYAFTWFADVFFEFAFRLSDSDKYLLTQRKIVRSNIFLAMICLSVFLMSAGAAFHNDLISHFGFLVFILIFPVISFFEDWKRIVIVRSVVFTGIVFGTAFILSTEYSTFYFVITATLLVYSILWTHRMFGK